MNKWNDLTMKERAALIKVGVANGFRNIDDIRDQYNSFYSDQQNYDYDMARWADEVEDKNELFNHQGHYTDKYKKPNHPTFSDESIYSNEQTPGGKWEYQNGHDTFTPSEYQVNTYGPQHIVQGLRNQGDTDVIPTYLGGTLLDEINVTPSIFANGGSPFNTKDNTEIYAGMLPELTVTPSNESKELLSKVRSNIPDKESRKIILEILDEQNTVFKNHPERSYYREDPNARIGKLSEIYNLSGRPKIYSAPSLGAKIGGLFGIDGGTSKTRPHMSPLLDRLYNIDSYNDLMAELSHSYNNKQIGIFNQGRFLNGMNDYTAYSRPYSLEHTTHRYTEPLLRDYINAKDSNVISIEDINRIIRESVEKDKKDFFESKNKEDSYSGGGYLDILPKPLSYGNRPDVLY